MSECKLIDNPDWEWTIIAIKNRGSKKEKLFDVSTAVNPL